MKANDTQYHFDANKGITFIHIDLEDTISQLVTTSKEYRKILYKYIPKENEEMNNIGGLSYGKYIFIKIQREMYELKRVVILTYKQNSSLLPNEN